MCAAEDNTTILVAPTIPELRALLAEYDHLFQPPTGLPPQRPCDYSIPLILGAQPVFVRPYLYAPLLKTEIERQVHDMLQQGLIQKSSSAFNLLRLSY